MTPAVVLAQLADLVSFLAMPRWAEANVLAAPLPYWAAIVVKVALIVLVVSVAYVLGRTNHPKARERLLLFGALAGAFGAGSNAAVLTAIGVQ